MNHAKYKELLQQAVYDELSHNERFELENHLFECEECKAEYEQLSKMYSVIIRNQPLLPDDNVLQNARFSLSTKLDELEENKSGLTLFIEKIKDFIQNNYKPAVSFAMALFVGIFTGYLVFGIQSPDDYQYISNGSSIDDNSKVIDDYSISNIRVPSPFTENGEIEIVYDLVKPIKYKGKIDDKRTKSLLAKALVSSENAGMKVQTLNSFYNINKSKLVDPSIKEALITTLKVDENVGVKLEALNILKEFPPDQDIKDALLFVLANDLNSGVRISAINALSEFTLENEMLDRQMREVLTEKAEKDDNDFIRLRAASILQENK